MLTRGTIDMTDPALEEAKRLRAARKAAKAAAAAAANPNVVTRMTAEIQWDPRGDDPRTISDDRERPEEEAISDADADYHEKAEGWRNRATRLNREGHLDGSSIATSHAEYHEQATLDGSRERRERKLAESQGKEY